MLAGAALFEGGCSVPKITLFPGIADPLREYTLKGDGKEKILLITVRGVITDSPVRRVFRNRPSVVQDIVSRLRLAEKDKDVKAVLLKINSPGGSTTAVDILYHEIMAFKKRTGAKVVAVMMDVAASGGYYIALASDYILAHPTTVTGSIGVMVLRLTLADLMDKIGVDVPVNKSGKNKDMASPFRRATDEEEKILQDIINDLGENFLGIVRKHRGIAPQDVTDIATGRIYVAKEAKKIGLLDEIGYMDDALSHARELAGLREGCRVVIYRRAEFPDDNLYHSVDARMHGGRISLLELGLAERAVSLGAGFYYLWPFFE